MPFNIESIAREYIYRRYPNASVPEKEKYITDWMKKNPIAQNVIQDFMRRIGGDPMGKKVIDVGCGNGAYSIAFAQAGAEVCAVEVEDDLHAISTQHIETSGVSATPILYDGHTLPFQDNVFDYAISISVLEHTTDPKRFLSEILRVMKPGGKFYIAFPNKLWLKETHTGLWFLTYLPAWLRPAMIRLFKRNPLEDNNLHFYTYFDFKKMIEMPSVNHSYWRILPEEGTTRSILKRTIKHFLYIFGIPYKAFLAHVSVILEKTT